VTGAAGFFGGYVVSELLSRGHAVVGVDNYSKYGKVEREHDSHPRYTLVTGDCKDRSLMRDIAVECDQIIAGAAMIGGISYFHQFAYDLLAENELILCATFDAAIHAFKAGRLQRINVLSSSMVFESTTIYPTPEGAERTSPPPQSTYGFQKLSSEYFARGAYEQYKLPYTIFRPFNCVGIGESRALSTSTTVSGHVRLAMSHVLPDLVQKVVKGQDPLHILGSGDQVRCYTHGKDLARGIALGLESDAAINNDFNLSTAQATTVLELAKLVWDEIHPGKPFRFVSDAPFEYDVQRRVPNVSKARAVLGFSAEIPVEHSVREVVQWCRTEIEAGRL
jgi:nucleoside-diphosphate-sugar epimerase